VNIDWKDLEAIKRLKYKYQRCIDTKQWDELRDCFTEDAAAAYSSGKFSFLQQAFDVPVATWGDRDIETS